MPVENGNLYLNIPNEKLNVQKFLLRLNLFIMTFILSPIGKIVLFILLTILIVSALYKINKLETGLVKIIWIIACVVLFPIVPIIYLLINFKRKQI